MAHAVSFEHPSSLLHDIGPHPEQPARITVINEALAALVRNPNEELLLQATLLRLGPT